MPACHAGDRRFESGRVRQETSHPGLLLYDAPMPREIPVSDGFPPSERTRVRRLPERGVYERDEIYPVVDAALTCTVAYLLDGRPHATATAHWRDGDRLYWHGSAASRFLKSVVGTEVSVSIHITDGIVLARSALTAHSTIAPQRSSASVKRSRATRRLLSSMHSSTNSCRVALQIYAPLPIRS